MFKIIKRERLKARCNKLLEKHDYTGAKNLATDGKTAFPKDAHFCIYEVWALTELKDLPQALIAVDQGLERFEDHPVLLNLKGEVHFKLGNLDQALENLQKVYQESPDNLHTSYILGQTYVAKGDLDQACKYFESILQYDPKLLQVRMLSMAERYIYERNKGL